MQRGLLGLGMPSKCVMLCNIVGSKQKAQAVMTTPRLFLHSEEDSRGAIKQTEQFYMTLKMMGKVPVLERTFP